MKLSFSILILLFVSIASEAQVTNEKAIERIDSLFQQVNLTTPGYTFGVIKDSNFVLERSYGCANLEHQIPLSSQSAFNIASLSKQFTAAAIALLILEDKLTLEDSVAPFFPDFPFTESDMRIKHLIYMTSGINDYYYNPRTNGTDWSSLHFFSIDTAIMASFGSEVLMYQPGDQWSYSNVNYMMLTKIVAQVSGQPFSVFVKEKILDPLGMYNTFVNDDIFQVIPNRVLGYNYRDEENTSWLKESGYIKTDKKGFLQINRNAPHYGGSGMFSTLEDLKKWNTNFITKKLGGQAFYDLMHKKMNFKHDKKNDAFGLYYGSYLDHEIIAYEGGDWGFSAYMMRIPKDNIAIICLSNIGTGNARSQVRVILDILIEEKVIELK